MSEPERLLQSGSDLERSLLESGQYERPSKQLQDRVRAAMIAAPLAAAPIAAAPAAPKAVSGIFAKIATTRGIAMLIAAIGIGAIVAASARMTTSNGSSAAATAPATATDTAPAPATATAAAAAAATAEVTITPDSLPSARVAVAPSPSAARVAAPAGSASIAREIELLDVVKTKLGAGSAAEAAQALDAYDREFPSGALRPEGTVLRIRTLLLQGNRAAANTLAEDFLQKNPGSVHAKRIQTLLAN